MHIHFYVVNNDVKIDFNRLFISSVYDQYSQNSIKLQLEAPGLVSTDRRREGGFQENVYNSFWD
jgi:hypothetical protein